MKKLSAQNITKFYQAANEPVKVLEDISLEIISGDFVVVLGASGCGKSTLLGLLAGFHLATYGKVLMDDKPLTGASRERAVVFQNDALLPWLSVLDNAAFGLHLQGVNKAERHERARAMLSKVGLLAFANHFIAELSGGMRQRLGLARALTAQADFLLMDEPLAALDALTREQMQELILQLWQSSKIGAFLITHSIEEAILMSTKLIILSPRPGRIVRRYCFDFSRRYASGESIRSIRSDAQFTQARTTVLDDILALTEEALI